MPVDARQADHPAPPTADDKAARVVADGKGQSAKKVVPVDSHGVQGDFIVGPRQFAGPSDAGQLAAERQNELSVFHLDLRVSAEGSFFPLSERVPVK